MQQEAMEDRAIREKIAPYEKYLVLGMFDKFIECVEKETGWSWQPVDETFISEKVIRLIAIHREGDTVYSILAYYNIDGFSYEGLDVDISDINEVREVLSDVL